MTSYACIPVTSNGEIASGFGKAAQVAVVLLGGDSVVLWRVVDVNWDQLHDSGEGAHHARIVRFMRDRNISLVVADHMGEPMQNTLTKLGIRVVLGASGEAQQALLAAAAS